MPDFTIGKVAREAGVKVDTVRFYERRGVLPEPSRSRANYRLYAEDTVRRVRFVRRAQGLGFTLREIRSLLDLRANPGANCGEVRRQALAKIEEIEEKIRSLRAMKKVLDKLADACLEPDASTGDCPILDSLESDEKGKAR